MGDASVTLREFAAETADLEEAAFLAAYPHPFLLREAMAPIPRGQAGAERSTVRVTEAAVPKGASDDQRVYLVRPRDPESNEGAVTLGRDDACDIVVGDGSISTLHARFTVGEDEEGERAFFVADAGSLNGTFLDGDRLEPEQEVPLPDQASLRFGPALKFQFFTAEGFALYLSYYRRMKRKPS